MTKKPKIVYPIEFRWAGIRNVWFTGDHHFFHKNIIEYTNRPFDSVEEMNEAMILCWNEVVKDDDLVFHLGDLTMGSWERAAGIVRRLKGYIYFLANPWHHDGQWLERCAHFYPGYTAMPSRSSIGSQVYPPVVVMEIDAGEKHNIPIVLCHYPFAEWDRKHYGSIHLHGHSHGSYKSPDPNDRIMDVGVDCNDFYPVNLWDILDYFGVINDTTK
jgi:calcineurin-like phosphoesterase family protein